MDVGSSPADSPQRFESSLQSGEGIVLQRIDYDKHLILHSDFSNRGLSQLDADGNEYMCACIRWSLKKHEANYSSNKGKMLAAVCYRRPRCFVIIS